jgi:hypothetical protein
MSFPLESLDSLLFENLFSDPDPLCGDGLGTHLTVTLTGQPANDSNSK